MIQQLQQYFLNPQNLIAAASILVLLSLYLLKPKPEKKMMPSVMFFREEENPGKLKQGIRKLLNNKFLFLHLLVFSLLAVALADPFVNSSMESEEATILLDATANTADNFEDYREYAESNLAPTTNLVVVGDQIETYTDLERSTASQIIQETSSTEIKRDIQPVISAATSLDGNLYMATNMASIESSEAERTITSASSQKYLDLKETEFSNSHGITDYEINNQTATIYVKNYLEEQSEITIQTNSDNRKIELEASGLEPVQVQLQRGRNNITLGEDEYEVDNSLYLYRPQSDSIRVRISDNLPYFREAVKSIPEARISGSEPDIEAVSGSDITDISREEIENGLDVIYFSETGVNYPDYLPVTSLSEENGDIDINRFAETTVYQEKYLSGNIAQDSGNYTEPASAIVGREIGQGTVVQYNLQGTGFEEQLVYPLFWRDVFNQVQNIRTISSSNPDTGSAQLQETKTVQGYESIDGDVYGFSTAGVFEPKSIDIKEGDKIGQKKQSVSQMVASLIFVLLILETVLLYRERLI